nr:CPCC family cysteine-rich protein [Pseudomonas luteola]
MERPLKYTCPCCGYMTLDDPARGTFDICELCGWEDDLVQNENPDYEGGANGICLREAQHEFLNKGVDVEAFVKDLAWQMLKPQSKESRLKHHKTDFMINSGGEVKKA